MRCDDAGALAVVFWVPWCGVFDGVDGALGQHGFLDALIIFHRYSLDPGHDSAPLDSASIGINESRRVGFGRRHAMQQQRAYQSSWVDLAQPKRAREWAAAHCYL